MILYKYLDPFFKIYKFLDPFFKIQDLFTFVGF